MIERFYLRSCLSFDEAALEFEPGLIVFSGPSGSGKSVLMRAILASFGLEDAAAALSESAVRWRVDEEASGLLNETPNVFREVKKEKARYFFNAQSVSRATLRALAGAHLRHLSHKDYADFEPAALLALVDEAAANADAGHAERLLAYRRTYRRYRDAERELDMLRQEASTRKEQEEFARYEIEKIDAIAPEPGEYEHLLDIKKGLSKKEKIEERIERASEIFAYEHAVASALEALETDGAFFDDAMNELRSRLEEAAQRLAELEATDIETVLDRLEALSDLKRRYGSVEDALAYRDKKRRELETLETLDTRLHDLRDEAARLRKELDAQAAVLSRARDAALPALEKKLNGYLKALYLDRAALRREAAEPAETGCDAVVLELHGTPLQKISAGEFNRLRLALLAVRSESMAHERGVLMLDEIDANLSGEESMSVAKVLRTLSRRFQILVISHQPQLTAMGQQHFLVEKNNGRSSVRALRNDDERIEEIARIVSGDSVSDKARHLARELLEAAKYEPKGAA